MFVIFNLSDNRNFFKAPSKGFRVFQINRADSFAGSLILLGIVNLLADNRG